MTAARNIDTVRDALTESTLLIEKHRGDDPEGGSNACDLYEDDDDNCLAMLRVALAALEAVEARLAAADNVAVALRECIYWMPVPNDIPTVRIKTIHEVRAGARDAVAAWVAAKEGTA